MTDAEDAATARSAAGVLHAAIDSHLAAVETRAGEEDPVVQQAYDALRLAAEAYDDVLFEEYDEVTPFEFADPADEPAFEVAEHPSGEALESVTVLVRRDYDVVDLPALFAGGRAARIEAEEGGLLAGAPGVDDDPASPPDAQAEPDEAIEDPYAEEHEDLGAAVYELVHAYGVDGLHARAEDVGLEPTGATVWLMGEVPGDIEADAFSGADEDAVLLRLDEVYGLELAED